MEKMYYYFECALRRKGHQPYWYPTVIPEDNFTKESDHLTGFSPEVFWVTHAGDRELDPKLALRPTSETIFYQMFALWVRSHNDLPFKTYQRAQVFRCDTKATRPFLRSREFHWIETHCVHRTKEDAFKQVKEDMETTKEVMHDTFGIPYMIFERPAWDKFPGADRTFAADALNPDGKVIQQPSTHMINQNFAKAFDVKFKDKDGKEKFGHMTCYGPAISRIFASVIITHGDDKGLKFPWEIAPVQVMVVPVGEDEKVLDKAYELKKKIMKFTNQVSIDTSDRRPGEKFNHWEMKGVPLRVDIGMKDIEKGQVTLFRRDLDQKEFIKEEDLMKRIKEISKEFTKNLIEKADKVFDNMVVSCKDIKEVKKVIKEGSIAKCNFCSVAMDGEKCAAVVEKDVGAEVRGTRLDEKEKVKGECVVCGKKAKHVVYIAKSY
jgi:prolyl-tRNA synthetase